MHPQHTHTDTADFFFHFPPRVQRLCCCRISAPTLVVLYHWSSMEPPPSPPCLSLKPPSRTLLPLPEGPRQRFPCSREEKRDPGMGSLPASTRRGRSCPAAASHPLTFIIKETPHPPPLSSPLTTPVERSYSASRRRSHC